MGDIIKFKDGATEKDQSSKENDREKNNREESILITLRNKHTTKYLNNLSNQFENQEILNDFINKIGKAAFSLKDYLKNQDKISPEGQKMINPIIIKKVKETANTINPEKKEEIEQLIQENPDESLGGIVNQICCILGIIGERDSLSEEEKKEEIKKYQQILNTQISNQDIIS